MGFQVSKEDTLQETITDSKKTAFIMVVIPEAMGLLESENLYAYLIKAQIPLNHVFINMVLPDTVCPVCVIKQKSQKFYIEKICRKFSKMHISQIPLFPHEIHGKSNLEELIKNLFKPDQIHFNIKGNSHV
jgi:anion-transporting  ArsA/GET3 family ATPase